MKKLVVCRHAKSSWKFPVADIYRPLNSRGLIQAPEMAINCEVVPDKVLCSPAVRAWSTAVTYFNELNWKYEVLQITPELYEASADVIMSLLKKQDNSVRTLFIFGHNPGFNDLVDLLTTNRESPGNNIVTSARVTLVLNIDRWSDITPGCGDVCQWSTPSKVD